MEIAGNSCIPPLDSTVLGRFDASAHPQLAALNQRLDQHGSNHQGIARVSGTSFNPEVGGDHLYLSGDLAEAARDLGEAGEYEHALTVIDEGVRWGRRYGESQVGGSSYAGLVQNAALGGQPDFAISLALDEERFREDVHYARRDLAELDPYHAIQSVSWWLSQASYVWRSLRETGNNQGLSPNLEARFRERVEATIELVRELSVNSGQLPGSEDPEADINWLAVGLGGTAQNFSWAGEEAWTQGISALDPDIQRYVHTA